MKIKIAEYITEIFVMMLSRAFQDREPFDDEEEGEGDADADA